MKNMNKLYFGQLLFVIVLAFSFPVYTQATIYTIDLALSGQKEVPPNPSTATGILIGPYDDVTNVLNFNLMFNGLTAPATAAHIHGPAAPGVNAPVLIPFAGFPTGVTSGIYSHSFTLTAQQESMLFCGTLYVNIHNSVYPGGELRSQVKEGGTSGNITTLDLALTGLKDVPPNASPATGTLIGTFNNTTDVLSFTILFNGMTAGTTAAHFHGPGSALVNAPVLIPFPGFPTGVTSGMYSNSFVLTPLQKTYFLGGLLYVNIHTTTIPGGEIRSQLTEGTLPGNCAANIPTLSEWMLIFLGILLVATGVFYIYRK
jgi:hypothetical protein